MNAAPAESVLGRRQLYMLPTRLGLLFAGLLLVQLLAAINYGNGLAYAFTFLLGSLAVVSMFHTHRNLHRLRVSAGAASAVFAGETASFRIRIANDDRVPRFGVVVRQGKSDLASVDIAPRDSASVALDVPAVTRGRLPMPPITVTTRFPLGLLYSWSRRITLEATCLVYPKPATPAPAKVLDHDTAAPATGLNVGGDDFIGTREYQNGDSPRHVDWKAVARGGPWQVKQFGGGTQVTVWLDWDQLQGIESEARLSVLTRWVLEAEQNGMRYGLRLPHQTLDPGCGEAHQHECLKRLALFELKP